MKSKLAGMMALAAMADIGMNTGSLGGTPQQPFGRMPQKDFEDAVRAKAKHEIEVANRKAAERAANPREKKRKKKAPVFSNNYIGMSKKVKLKNK